MKKSKARRPTRGVPKPDTKWFKEQIATNWRGSLRHLAEAMRMEHSALSLTLRGKRHVKLAEAALLARLLRHRFMDVVRRLGVKV